MTPATGAFGGQRNLLFAGLFLALLSVVSHATGIGAFGVALFPIALFLIGFNAAAYLLLSLAGFIVFFQANLDASNMWVLNTPDLALPAFLLIAFAARRSFDFRLPVSGLMVALYAFLAFAAFRTIGPALSLGPADHWLLRDAKCLAYLASSAYFVRHPLLGPKSLSLILLAMVMLTAVHGAICLGGSLMTGMRSITWNEIYIADGLVLALVLLTIPQLRAWRKPIGFSLGIIFLSLLVTETRGMWIAALASVCVYAAVTVATSTRDRLKRIGKGVGFAVLAGLAAGILLKAAVGFDVVGKITGRLAEGSVEEVVNPYSSLGYRLHESFVVWEQRTWLGHGTGARLHLFFTQLGKSEVMDWWSIHSEYFEILHKYGFVGLGLFLAFLGVLARRALRIALSPRAFPAAMGLSVLLCLVNHVVSSITSGYLIREHVMVFLVLMVVVVERFHPGAVRAIEADKALRARRTDPGPA